ncbi:mating-type switching swi10 protein [Rutstroemia sp. NJR-2017a BVV2]|nr:mating-type switching swi10 protein [Rutstroemia sp. NJR-2017a BVV2]
MSFFIYFFTNNLARLTKTKTRTRKQAIHHCDDLLKDPNPPWEFPGILSDFRAQSCLTLIPEDAREESLENLGLDVADDVANLGGDIDERKEENLLLQQLRPTPKTKSQPHLYSTLLAPALPPPPPTPVQISIDLNLRTKTSLCRIPSDSSLSVYSSDPYSCDTMDPTDTKFWRRAKTPVFAIGQLERKAQEHKSDPSESIAAGYRCLLPPRRSIAPQLDLDIPHKPLRPVRKSLRKIKSQESLRDLCKSHSVSPFSASDCETLVGSDGGTSPRHSLYQDELKNNPFDAGTGDLPRPNKILEESSPVEQDVGLQICSDLLTSKLRTALHRQDLNDKKLSGLQILLMIEAYESVREQLREDYQRDRHVTDTEAVLDNWIEALYTIYEESILSKRYDKGNNRFPLRRPSMSSSQGSDDSLYRRKWSPRLSPKPLSTFAEHFNSRGGRCVSNVYG